MTWTTIGEGSVTGDTVTMGVAGRPESGTQPTNFHGAYALLPSASSYQIPFTYDLSTWDSYNASYGYWDSFSVSITSVPYPQLNLLQDPIQFPFVWGGAEYGGHVLQKDTGSTTISATFNKAGPHYLNVILDTKTLPTADNNYPSWGTVQVITGSLGIVTDTGSELPDSQNQSSGGYVAVNNEDADYNGTPDLSQAGPIMGEADLVPLDLNPIDPIAQKGTYTLNNLSSNLKIYMNPDKSDPVTNTTTFDATKATTVWVEGIAESSGKAKEEIDLNWTNGTLSATLDKAKYTVYQVKGPADVPDYSSMPYKADIPGNGTGSWTATNGTVQTGANTNTATILWGGGPANGEATFSPAPGFSVDYAVNVVQVLIENPSVGNAFTPGTPQYNGMFNYAGTNVPGPFIASGNLNGVPGMQWSAKVTLNGPSANGVDQRGVTHIEVGFVQNLTFTAVRGDYLVNGVIQSLTGNVQGMAYHDSSDPAQVYYFNGSNAVFKPTGTIATQRTLDGLTSNDTPSGFVPLYFQQGATLGASGDGILATMHFTDTFQLWITARTDDTDNGASQIYTSRAVANWVFAVNENYTSSGFANPLTNSMVTVPASWTPVTDGSQPTLKNGKSANQALAVLTFS